MDRWVVKAVGEQMRKSTWNKKIEMAEKMQNRVLKQFFPRGNKRDRMRWRAIRKLCHGRHNAFYFSPTAGRYHEAVCMGKVSNVPEIIA